MRKKLADFLRKLAKLLDSGGGSGEEGGGK